jgi:hypothetical protein
MLTDAEVALLRTDPRYAEASRLGLGLFVDSILESGAGDLNPSISNFIKLATRLWRAHTIRVELQKCTCALLERMIDGDIQWERNPQEVRLICNAHEAGYKWMRYDEQRVLALFRRCYDLLTDATFRSLLKEHSSLPEAEKNQQLIRLRAEIRSLEVQVVRSIRTRGIFDSLTDLNADEYYRQHEAEIQGRFLQGTQGGALGLPGDHE